MRVLLISPLPRIDPPCGDIVYTETLLAYPPEGVKYVTYADAILDGSLVEHARSSRFRREPTLALVAKAINLLRCRKWLFWEPFRFFSVQPGVFDAIHVHVFSCAFLNRDCPVVISNAASLRLLYRDARNWSARRTAIVERVEQVLASALSVNHTSYHVPDAERVIAFTSRLRDWYVGRQIAPAEHVDTVPIYLPPVETVATGAGTDRRPTRVGFVAKDFDAKGGAVLLKAFETVRTVRPDITLTIVGCPSRMGEAEAAARSVRWVPYVPREQLLNELLPSFDVFAYPTEFDGMPLVVLEALSIGIPVATSDYEALPELVDHGRAGRVSPVGDAAALASNVLALLEPDENRRARTASRAWFDRTFSAAVVRPKLLDVYERAISQWTASKAGASA